MVCACICVVGCVLVYVRVVLFMLYSVSQVPHTLPSKGTYHEEFDGPVVDAFEGVIENADGKLSNLQEIDAKR